MESWEEARVSRARSALGDALDEVESRFTPAYLGKIASFTVQRSFKRHRVAWGVAGGVTAAVALGLVVWAIMSDDD